MAKSKDISEMSMEEIQSFLEAKKEKQREELQKNFSRWKFELEQYCLKTYRVPLGAIYTATNKPRKIRHIINPKTGETYTYKGRGMLPKWVIELEATETRLLKVIK